MSLEFIHNGRRVKVITTERDGRWSWEYFVDDSLAGFLTDRTLSKQELAADGARHEAIRVIERGVV